MSSCVRVPLSPARDRYQTRRWAACSLQQAIQIAPSERSGHKSRSAPEHARSTVPARPARILVLEGDHPGGTERARRRRWPPNMQPRIVPPHVSASPAPSARRTGVLRDRLRRHRFVHLVHIDGHAGNGRALADPSSTSNREERLVGCRSGWRTSEGLAESRPPQR